jgi:hypothetical protein
MEVRQPGSHLDQLLRQTRVHHVQLSSMADLKANMLLTIASVVITMSIRYVTDPEIRLASGVLIAFCLLTILLAAYSVMPKLTSFAPKKLDPNSGSFNLLFFGHFIGMDYEEYESAMEKVLNDPSKVYELQVREIYSLGQFLAHQKYRYLRLAYLAFIVGLLASGAVMLITL